jgi:competence protein ComEC
MDVSNAYNRQDTPAELAVKASAMRAEMLNRTNVPSGKIDFQQKKNPDNPIEYLKSNLGVSDIFRFIISHPDMDHLDGIKDLYTEFKIWNTWDTDNNKFISSDTSFAGYNKEDWEFYTTLREGKISQTKRLTLFDSTAPSDFWKDDGIQILCPSPQLITMANRTGDYNDTSYVLLFTFPKSTGGVWKVIFSGDSDDHAWDHILERHADAVSDIDVLMAPHHGRDSGRNYDFLKILKPKITLLGNASSKHLAYSCYPETRITNNQAGFVVIDIAPNAMTFYVKHREFAKAFVAKRSGGDPPYSERLQAYAIGHLNAA